MHRLAQPRGREATASCLRQVRTCSAKVLVLLGAESIRGLHGESQRREAGRIAAENQAGRREVRATGFGY